MRPPEGLVDRLERTYNVIGGPGDAWQRRAKMDDNRLVGAGIDLTIDGMDGDSMVCRVNGVPYYLVYNPVSDNYLLADAARRLAVWPGNYCKICKCDTLRYICFIISKNGCSCILRSALQYDGYMETSEDRFIWQYTCDGDYNCRDTMFNGVRAKAVLEDPRYRDYKRFIILQDERERFIKFINWTHERPYNPYLNMHLGREDSFREHVFLHPYFSRDVYACDQHALPQDKHVEAFIGQLYGGDAGRFWNEVEAVGLDDLQEWFADTFGKPLLLNNMTAEKYKIYRLDTLRDSEMESLEKLLEPYELYERYS